MAITTHRVFYYKHPSQRHPDDPRPPIPDILEDHLAGPQIKWYADGNIESKSYAKLGRVEGEITTNARNGQVEDMSFHAGG